MGRRVLVIVLLVVVALLAYAGYSSYDSRRAGASGQVFSNDSTPERPRVKSTTPSANPTPSQEPETIVYPSTTPAATTAPAVASTGPAANQVTQGQQSAPATAPASDTISPNPPNGMTFAGSGRYQLYRQGNITWRLDTETGRSCIIFATDEEWKKPRVYKAGCGRN
jgi:hypothetical protein